MAGRDLDDDTHLRSLLILQLLSYDCYHLIAYSNANAVITGNSSYWNTILILETNV